MTHARSLACLSLWLVSLGLGGCAGTGGDREATPPFPMQDQGTARRHQTLTRQQEALLAACPDATACAQAHFIRALLALSEDPKVSAEHFRGVLTLDAKGRLAAASQFWLELLVGQTGVAGHEAPPARIVARLVQDIIERELLLQRLAKEAGQSSVETVRDALQAKDRQIEELTRQVEALKRVDFERRKKPARSASRAGSSRCPTARRRGENHRSPMEPERILIVDDDEGLLRLLKMRLTGMGFAVVTCTSGAAALVEARRATFDLAIIDLRLQDLDGLVLLDELLLIHPSLPVLILTAHGSIPNAVEAMQKGAYGYLAKPFDTRTYLKIRFLLHQGIYPE